MTVLFKDRDATFQKIWTFTNKAREQAVQKRRFDFTTRTRRSVAEAREALAESRQGKMILIVRAVTTLHQPLTYKAITQNFPAGLAETVSTDSEIYCQACGTPYPCEELRMMTDIIDGKGNHDQANAE